MSRKQWYPFVFIIVLLVFVLLSFGCGDSSSGGA